VVYYYIKILIEKKSITWDLVWSDYINTRHN